MNYLNESIKTEFKSPINLIASLLTIINFAITFWSEMTPSGLELAHQNISFSNIGFSFILLTLMVVFVGNFLAKLFVIVDSYGEGPAMIYSFTIALFFAWIFIFNIDWLIKSPLAEFTNITIWGKRVIGLIVNVSTIFIFTYLVKYQWQKEFPEKNYFDDEDGVISKNGRFFLAYILMVVIYWMMQS
ncbi:MAG: hypothetical protein KDC85_06560 [Saprospiraceae bacterium]|nr:hypothetical protein [Saprospiraceae bacterium]MCB9326291.1 hypothetical protein [Lewinellaceae bacterium]